MRSLDPDILSWDVTAGEQLEPLLGATVEERGGSRVASDRSEPAASRAQAQTSARPSAGTHASRSLHRARLWTESVSMGWARPERGLAWIAVASATAIVAWSYALPGLFAPVEALQDAEGHLAAAQTLRERFWPAWTGWNSSYFCGYPQGASYPPLTHVSIAALGTILPLEIALRCVLALAVGATPWSAWVFARGRGARPGTASLFALLATALLFIGPTLAHGLQLSTDFYTLYQVGLTANAVGLPLFFLAASRARCAIVAGRGLGLAGALGAACVLSHMVCALALVVFYAVEVGFAVLRHRRRRRLFGHAVVVAGACFGFSAFWSLPLFTDLGYGVVHHLPSEHPLPLMVATLATALGALLLRRSPRIRWSLAGAVALFTLVLAGLLALGDLAEVRLHLYRFHVFVFLGLAYVSVELVRGARARLAAGVSGLALLFALAWNRDQFQDLTPLPEIAVPLDLPTDARVLIVASPAHQPSSHWLQNEFPRRAQVDGVIGLFVESTPLGRWCMNLMRSVSLDTFVWGVGWNESAVAPIARDLALARMGGDATETLPGVQLLGRELERFGITHVLTESRLPDELVEPGVVVCQIPGAWDGSERSERERGDYLFRLHEVRSRPRLAELVREPLESTAWSDLESWNRAVATWSFATSSVPRPVVARPGLVLDPAPDTARVTALERLDQGRRYVLDVEADSDVPVVLKVAWHPRWRARCAGREIRVDRVAPGFCLVHGRGRIELRFEPRWSERLGTWLTALTLVLAGGAALRRRAQLK